MMGNKRKEAEAVAVRPAAIETIIGENAQFEGILRATTTLRIDGLLKGDIDSESTVIVGEKGRVIGKVKAASIFISGNVDGEIDIKERTEFSSTGYLKGDIKTKLLIVAEGAGFDGTCSMKREAEKVTEISQARDNTKKETTEDKKTKKA